ncbi:MAG TPA: aminotransferase class IV [Niabella sp.]|nr:aminotransferase class IV [Niabella sp.]HOZ95816.1 aminotransferase class IV [Niabella sp.]HQW13670.1 aminotransferase class IV [Niabella sp.]HQX19064.1 aminotransferase class IV [Niabella sp.]HQX41997.1 aminotransferase class IV [Niabella sp.]
MSWVFVNDNYFEENDSVLGVGDLSIQRGYAVFDYFRTRENKPLFLDDYLNRFFNSAKELFIDIPCTPDQIKEVIYKLIDLNNIPQSGFRLTATGGYAPDNYLPVKGNLIIQQQAITLPTKEKFEQGIRIITHPYTRDFPTAKSTNYLMGIWMQQQLVKKQIDDLLYYSDGIISEFPRANVFIISQTGELITPSNNVLEGITRKQILTFASDFLPVSTRDITIDELKKAAEVFMTSTTRRILPVVEIDGKKIGEGRAGTLSTRLLNRFLSFEQEYLLAN